MSAVLDVAERHGGVGQTPSSVFDGFGGQGVGSPDVGVAGAGTSAGSSAGDRRRARRGAGAGRSARHVRSCVVAPSERWRAPIAAVAGPRLTRRGRVVLRLAVVGVVAAVVAVALLGSLGGDQTGPAEARASAGSTVVVQPGESLWQIAERVAPSVDRRLVVDRIAERNQLTGTGELQIGDELTVPSFR